MAKIKIAVIGGASVFTPEFVQSMSDRLNDREIEIVLMDMNKTRLEVVGEFCQRILDHTRHSIRLLYADNYEEAISGADFVLIQIRCGLDDMRIEDEKLGKKYQIPFAETISVCGISTYLRTEPVFEELAAIIKEKAPDAWVMNFSNPAGQLSETLYKLGIEKVIGCCNAVLLVKDFLASLLDVNPDDLSLNWRGLNHLTFTDKIYYQGKNIYPHMLKKWETSQDQISAHVHRYGSKSYPIPYQLVEKLGLLPNPYLQYYYLKDEKVKYLLSKETLRSEEVKELNAQLIEQYKESSNIPDTLKRRGGYGYAGVITGFITDILNKTVGYHYLVIKNENIFPALAKDAFIEVPVMTYNGTALPLQADPLPQEAKGLVITQKLYESALIEAAFRRDKSLLFKAIMMHPLIPSFAVAKGIMEDTLQLNRDYMSKYE